MHKNSDFDTETYLRIWIRQLLQEFEEICWAYKIKLPLPVFEITHSKKIMGAWLPEARTIRISSALILGYSWQLTLNVLKHEMAHQICADLFNSHDKAHGRDFQRACTMLGVPKEMRGAAGDMKQLVCAADDGGILTARGRKFIARVEKLLALAGSSNENEAVLAMQKANELIEKYSLGQMTDRQRSPYTYVIINSGKCCIQRYQRRICGILRDFFYVKVVYAFLYDSRHDCRHKTIELFGTAENVAIGEYCYHFLENQLTILWRQHRHKYLGNSLRAKNSYYLGVLNGFYKKILGQRQTREKRMLVADGTNALAVQDMMAAESSKIDVCIAQRFPRLSSRRLAAALVYSDTFADGVAAGGRINLHKGVAAHAGNMGHLLPL